MIKAAYASYLEKIEPELHISPTDLWKHAQSKEATYRISGKTIYERKIFENRQQIFDICADNFLIFASTKLAST